MSDVSRHRATWLGVASIAQWACLPLLAAVAGDIPPFQLTGLAFGVSFMCVLARWLLRGDKVTAHFRLPLPLWCLGAFGLFGFHFLYFMAFQHAPKVDAFLMVELWPLLIVFFAAPLTGEKLHLHHMVGAALGFAGVGLVATKGEFHGLDPAYLPGYLMAIGAAVTWALYSALSRRFAAHMDDEVVGAFCGLSALLSLVCHALFEVWEPLSGLQWGMLILMGLGPVGLAFFTWNVGMKHGNIMLLGILSLAIPLLGTLLLILFGFGEFSPSITLAAALVVAGGVAGSGMWKRRLEKSV